MVSTTLGSLCQMMLMKRPDEELQMMLADILGYEELDLVAELIAHRREVIKPNRAARQEDGIMGRLQTRQEREEALLRRDYEHKHATLASSVNRSEAQYPHVYKAHEAGNMLSSCGKKYLLPAGSNREEHEVCILSIHPPSRSYDLCRNMKSMLYLRPKSVFWVQGRSLLRSRIWTVFAS